MIHPDTELRWVDEHVGYGVFATRFIPRGTVVWLLCELDARYAPERVAAMPEPYREILYRYAYVLPDGDFVLCWDNGRYVNHSCDPTSFAVGIEFEIAGRDVPPGDQITCDYGGANMMRDLECRCGAPRCRGRIRPEDVLTYGREWDETAARALREAARVPQPLRAFIRDQRRFDLLVRGEADMPSVTSVYCANGLRQRLRA